MKTTLKVLARLAYRAEARIKAYRLKRQERAYQDALFNLKYGSRF